MRIPCSRLAMVGLLLAGCATPKVCEQPVAYELGYKQGVAGKAEATPAVPPVCDAEDRKQYAISFRSGFRAGLSEVCRERIANQLGEEAARARQPKHFPLERFSACTNVDALARSYEGGWQRVQEDSKSTRR